MPAPFRTRWVQRGRDGDFVLGLPEPVRNLLVDLVGQLEPLLESDAGVVKRVFPVAYPDDVEREAGYQAMIRGELIERHREGVALISATAGAERLAEDELARWMTTINALRLMLGTALDVREDQTDPTPSDERQPLFEIYAVLNVVLDDIVDALSASL